MWACGVWIVVVISKKRIFFLIPFFFQAETTTLRNTRTHHITTKTRFEQKQQQHTHTHTHTHTHDTHTHQGVVSVWTLVYLGTAAVCEQCELPVREPHYDLWSEQGRPSYGWRRVRLPDGCRFIGRAKTEGRNSYRGVVYDKYTVVLQLLGTSC